MKDRPICSHENCSKPVKISKSRGKTYFNKICSMHADLKSAAKVGCKTLSEYKLYSDKKLAKKRGITLIQLRLDRLKRVVKNKGFKTSAEYSKYIAKQAAKKKGISITQLRRERLMKTALKKGFKSVTEYQNSIHKYKKYKKDYCENRNEIGRAHV